MFHLLAPELTKLDPTGKIIEKLLSRLLKGVEKGVEALSDKNNTDGDWGHGVAKLWAQEGLPGNNQPRKNPLQRIL